MISYSYHHDNNILYVPFEYNFINKPKLYAEYFWLYFTERIDISRTDLLKPGGEVLSSNSFTSSSVLLYSCLDRLFINDFMQDGTKETFVFGVK